MEHSHAPGLDRHAHLLDQLFAWQALSARRPLLDTPFIFTPFEDLLPALALFPGC